MVGPTSRTGRDLVVLMVVLAVLGALVRFGSGIDYAVPVSIGNATISNSREVIADAEDRLHEMIGSYGGRIAEDAACYFLRPLGPTQGGLPADMFAPFLDLAGLTSSDAPPDVLDPLLCGPVELAARSPFLASEPPPWLAGMVFYYEEAPLSLRGEVQLLIQSELAVLTAVGGAQREHLLGPDGRPPGGDAFADPVWREVTPSGEPPETPLPGFPGAELPPGVSVPEMPPGVPVPELPPSVTIPAGASVPEPAPGLTVPAPGG